MSIQIEGVGTQKIQYRDAKDVEFYSLEHYLTLAKKAISKFANNFYRGLSIQMLKDEDAISSIANAIMMADWRFDENYESASSSTGLKKTRYSYRNQCALWAIQSYVTKSQKKDKKHKLLSLDYKATEENRTPLCYIADHTAKNPETIFADQEETGSILNQVKEIMALDIITDRQKSYLSKYYLENYTYDQIGKEFQLTREAVRQSMKKAIKSIREFYNAEV